MPSALCCLRFNKTSMQQMYGSRKYVPWIWPCQADAIDMAGAWDSEISSSKTKRVTVTGFVSVVCRTNRAPGSCRYSSSLGVIYLP